MILGPQSRDPFKINGVVIGIVIDNKDPDGHYRVKVKYPWVLESGDYASGEKDDEDFISTWCRMTTLFAGGKDTSKSRGSFFLPEVDDEVLIAFEHGDLRRPYIIGALWNGEDKPIDSNNDQGGKNNFRSIVSRSGHVIQFVDDNEGADEIIIQTLSDANNDGSGDFTRKDPHERSGHFIRLTHGGDKGKRVEIYDTSKKNWIYIHTDENMIEINSEKDIHIKAKETIDVECKDFKLKADKTIKVESGTTTDHKAGGAMTIKSDASIKEKAPVINLN